VRKGEIMYEAEVQRGLAWLKSTEAAQAFAPDLDRVQLDILRMEFPWSCVLGQAIASADIDGIGYEYSGYWRVVLSSFNPSTEDDEFMITHGFRTDFGGEYGPLTEAWREALTADRAAS
jgi:hypothetical protein